MCRYVDFKEESKLNLWYTIKQHCIIYFAILKLKMETPLFVKS